MSVKENLYEIKKKTKKFYRDYFTVDGTYTNLLSDKQFISRYYRRIFNRELNWNNPTLYSEKINWLKLYDRQPIYTVMADKYASREFITERFGEGYLVDLLGVWDSSDDIDFDTLPDKFVLKCNHDNGVLICKDKNSLDFDKVRKEFTDRLNCDFYKKRREWPYKNIKRKIICEKLMENTDGSELLDYKVFCFNGIARIIEVNSDRFSGHSKEDHYDINWNHLDLKFEHYEQSGDRFEKPVFFDEMINISEKTASGIPFLRVDFNCWNGKIYIGEMTFYHNAGFAKFEDYKWDELLGSWIELPNRKTGV